MWFEKIAGVVIGQIALSVLLAVVLWQLWARLRREQHLAFWSLSWAATAVYIASLSLYVVSYQYGGGKPALMTWVSLLTTIGWLEPAFVVLAAWSLRSGRVKQRQVWITCIAALVVGLSWWALAWSHGSWMPAAEPFQRLQIIVAPRTFVQAVGMACYALFFRRWYSRARGFSGWLTIVFCLAYTAHLLLVALGDIGIRLYGDPNGLLNSTMGTIVPMGITLGIVMSVLEQAEHSESAVRSVWESPVAMRLADAEGYVTSVNPAFCAMMGRSKEQLEGHLVTECYDPALSLPLLERFRERFATRTVEPRLRRSFERWDGKPVEAELTNSFVETPTGPQLLSLMQDTTREHEATEALRRSEERLQLLLDSISDAVFDLRMDGSSVERYTRFRKMLGYETEEMPETLEAWLALLHPEDRAALPENPVDGLDASGNLIHWEYRLRHKAGHWVWVRSAAKVIEWDETGRPLRMVGTMTDISEYKAAEAQARRLESELLQTRKMEAIGRLAGGVAHDFNNHLTVINGYCDMLLARTTDAKLTDKLTKIRTAGERAAALTVQLLAVSRRQAVRPRPIHLNLLVEELDTLVHRLIGENIEIVTRLDPDLGMVEADPGQIHQVLMNLTLNARDAMPAGGRITIQTATEIREDGARPGQYAHLSVGDNGHGMSAEILERIFEPFFTTKSLGAGTGLGLSSVYGIVQQAGGWVEVDSAPGRGSTFRVYLPILERASSPAAPERPHAELPGGTETVLVVEDQEDLRRVAVEILREQGYRVLEAGDGDEALSVCTASEGPVHLLFTDLVMPGMDGRELARLIRERTLETRVLFTSGYQLGDRQAALAAGETLLPKPFSPSQLCGKVRDVLDGKEDSRSMLAMNDVPPASRTGAAGF